MNKRSIFFFACSLLLCSCSYLHREIPEFDQAASFLVDDPPFVSQVVAAVEQNNSDLRSYKGTGRAKFTSGNSFQTARIVFAGLDGRKLRFEVLGLSGQPVTSIAYDGAWLYLAQHTESRFVKKKAANVDLHQLITVPVKINEINMLLSGKVPIIEYASVELRKETEGDGYFLVFKGKGSQRLQEIIYLMSDLKTVWKYKMYANGRLTYAALIKDIKRYNVFHIPQEIEFTDNEHNRLLLKVERYWPNADVASALFVLKKPDF